MPQKTTETKYRKELADRFRPLDGRFIVEIDIPKRADDTEAPLSIEQVREALLQRDVLATIIDGTQIGRPKLIGVRVALDSSGCVLLDGRDGRVVSGPHIEEFLPGFSYRIQRPIVVDQEILVGGPEPTPGISSKDKRSTEPALHSIGSPLAEVSEEFLSQILGDRVEGLTWVWWRQNDLEVLTARMMATAWQSPVSLSTMDGINYVVPDPKAGAVNWPVFDRADRPAGIVNTLGEARGIRVQGKGQKSPVDFSFNPRPERVQRPSSQTPRPSGEVELLLGAVQDYGMFPDATMFGKDIPGDLFDAFVGLQLLDPLSPIEERFTQFCQVLNVPVPIVAAVKTGGSDLATILGTASAGSQEAGSSTVESPVIVTRIEPDANARAAAWQSIKTELVEPPQGKKWHQRLRRQLLKHPVMMIFYGLVELLLAAAAVSWTIGAFGPSAPGGLVAVAVWALVVVWVFDGLYCVAFATHRLLKQTPRNKEF